MDKSVNSEIHGELFVFDCRRAIYWPKQKILLAADLHWGKTQFLRSHGVAISDKVFEADLERLAHVLDDYDVSSLIVLGDLVHHEKALSSGIINKVANFRDQFPCELILVKGNHDRYAKFPPSWGVVEEQELNFGPFLFAHEFRKNIKSFQFAGHVHPMLRLSSGHDSLRLPSFILDDKFCLLPAFSHLTGGQDVRLEKGQKAMVLTHDGVEVFEKGR